MTAQVKDVTAGQAAQSGVGAEETTLAELRRSVSEITTELAKIAEKRSRLVKDAAQAGTSQLRRTIRRQPVVAMGVATLGGALLALAVVPRWGAKRSASRWEGWVPHVTRADLHDVAESIQRSVTRAVNAAPGVSSLDRLSDAFAKLESNQPLNEMLQKAGTWLQRLRSRAS